MSGVSITVTGECRMTSCSWTIFMGGPCLGGTVSVTNTTGVPLEARWTAFLLDVVYGMVMLCGVPDWRRTWIVAILNNWWDSII